MTRLTVTKSPLILTQGLPPFPVPSTEGKLLSYFMSMLLCTPWAPSPVGKQGKQSKGVSQSRCYAPRRVHAPHASRIRPPATSAGGSAGCCPAPPPTPGLLLSGRQILVVGKVEKCLQTLAKMPSPQRVVSRARAHIFYSHSWHLFLR